MFEPTGKEFHQAEMLLYLQKATREPRAHTTAVAWDL